jgi:hypothetical protein
MTDHDHDSVNARLDAWLARSIGDVDRVLATKLDIETGLRDVRLLHRVHTLDSRLRDVLDVDAGLQAIIGAQNVRSSSGQMVPTTIGPSGLVPDTGTLNELSLQVRLQLRSLLVRDETLNALYEEARDSAFFHSLSNDATTLLQLVSAHDTTTPVLRGDHSEPVIYNLCAFGIALSHKIDDFVSKFAVHQIDASPLSVSFSAALHDRSLPQDTRAELIQIRRAALTIGQVVELVLTGIRKINQPGLISNLARDIDTLIERFDTFILSIGTLHEDAIRGFYTIAGDLKDRASMSATEMVVNHILDLLEDAVRCADIDEVHSIGNKLAHLLSDFTSEDLTRVNLDGVNLRGVRWSLTNTRWPEGWREAMLKASTPLVPEPPADLYEVRDDPQVPHLVSQPTHPC